MSVMFKCERTFSKKMSDYFHLKLANKKTLQGRIAGILNRHMSSNLAELLLNICSFSVSKCLIYVLFLRLTAGTMQFS